MNNTIEEDIKGGIHEMGKKDRSRQNKQSHIASYTLSSFSSSKILPKTQLRKNKSGKHMKLTKSTDLLSLNDNSKKK